MNLKINNCCIQLIQGDITREKVDAIVNAANSRLAGGGGVDGAIHRAGGPEIMKECRTISGGCPTGSAVATSAGNLKAKYVFHAVGPIWRGGDQREAEHLEGAYQTCMELACKKGCKSIAFPAISTGIYGYPLKDATQIAIRTISRFLKEHGTTTDVRLVVFDDKTRSVYEKVMEELLV